VVDEIRDDRRETAKNRWLIEAALHADRRPCREDELAPLHLLGVPAWGPRFPPTPFLASGLGRR
jgi:hypothetical protein